MLFDVETQCVMQNNNNDDDADDIKSNQIKSNHSLFKWCFNTQWFMSPSEVFIQK